MNRKKRMFALLMLLALVLSGCTVSGGDTLYAVPQRSDVYLELQRIVEDTMGEETPAAPLAGEHQRAVQEVDLDGDGIVEVLVFSRGSEEQQPLRLHIFCQETGEYSLLSTIPIEGTAFDRVDYAQIDGRPGQELVVTSRISGEVLQSLSVYSLSSHRVDELLRTGCISHAITDLDSDGLEDLITFYDTTSSFTGVAAYYRWQEDVLWRCGEDTLSVSAERIESILTGQMAEGVPAVFVSGSYDGTSTITDVFVSREDAGFRNVSPSSSTPLTTLTVLGRSVYSTDIDGDGIIELPETKLLSAFRDDVNSHNQYCILWYNLRSDGSLLGKCTTYHNFSEGWYLKLEDIYYANLYATHRVDETLGGGTCLLAEDLRGRHEIISIYPLTGSLASDALESGKVILLARRGETYYCAVLGEDLPMDVNRLQSNFGFIATDPTP